VSRPADATSDVADVADGASRRAERLLRWYPRPWRDRYGADPALFGALPAEGRAADGV
jgi:hypothetical protein